MTTPVSFPDTDIRQLLPICSASDQPHFTLSGVAKLLKKVDQLASQPPKPEALLYGNKQRQLERARAYQRILRDALKSHETYTKKCKAISSNISELKTISKLRPSTEELVRAQLAQEKYKRSLDKLLNALELVIADKAAKLLDLLLPDTSPLYSSHQQSSAVQHSSVVRPKATKPLSRSGSAFFAQPPATFEGPQLGSSEEIEHAFKRTIPSC